MAENGWTDEEIRQLRAEVNLAIAEADKQAYEMGLTRDQQTYMKEQAKEKALQVGHDRFHRRLEAMMEAIQNADAKAIPVAHGGSHVSAEDRARLKKLFD